MKGRIKPDHIKVNEFELRIAGVLTLFPIEVTGIEKENPSIDLPDNTTAAGGNPKPIEFVVKVAAHHKDEVVYWNQWAEAAVGVQGPLYKRPVVYTMRSGTNKNLLIANLEGVWVTKTKLPDGEMKNDGEIAIIEYTCKADDVNFI